MLDFIKKLIRSIDKFHQPSLCEQVLDKLTQLEPSKFKYAQSSNMSIFYVKVPIYNIVDYSYWLEKYTDQLRHNKVIQPYDINSLTKDVSIGQFFTGQKGFLIQENVVSDIFMDRVYHFANLYKDKSNEITEDFTREHNLRMLTPILANLLNLLNELANITWPK